MKQSAMNTPAKHARYKISMWFSDPKLDYWEYAVHLWYVKDLVGRAQRTYPKIRRILVEPLRAKNGFRLDWRKPET